MDAELVEDSSTSAVAHTYSSLLLITRESFCLTELHDEG